jgi:FMN phosphatase YigB (HAD superfamily)
MDESLLNKIQEQFKKLEIKMILFDLDQTLVYGPPRSIKYDLIQSIFREKSYNVPLQLINNAYNNANVFYDMCAHLFNGNEDRLYRTFCRIMLQQCKVPQNEALILKLSKELRFSPKIIKNSGVFPEVKDVCCILKEKNLILGVISTNISSKKRLKKEGLNMFFDTIYSTADGLDKPAQLKMALKKTGKKGKETIVIGNSYTMDVVIPQLFGFIPLLLDRNGIYGEVDCITISSLEEILELI